MCAFFEVDVAGNDKTRGDARMEGEASAYPILVVEDDGIDGLMYILRCPERAEVVILVGFRDAEEGHHRIADILFDEALISVNDLGSFPKIRLVISLTSSASSFSDIAV